MFAAGLALAASASWGIGDFLAGTRSRLMSPLAVLALSQPVGLVLLAIAVAARGSGPPDAGVAWACLGGVFGTVGLASFYRGMATGAISIVAPIAGAAAVIPVVYGFATGDDTTGLQRQGLPSIIVFPAHLTRAEHGCALAQQARGRPRLIATPRSAALHPQPEASLPQAISSGLHPPPCTSAPSAPGRPRVAADPDLPGSSCRHSA